MPIPSGRRVPLTVPRRLVADLMHFSRQLPLVAIDRRMRLGALVAARRDSYPRPSWTSLFVKAFARVAEHRPELRRTYFRFPWPHFYEHPESVAVCTVERQDDGEVYPLAVTLQSPERRSLHSLDDRLGHAKTAPQTDVHEWRQSNRLGRLPWPLRRLAWWALLNLSGRIRAHYVGTYAVTSVAAEGAGGFHVLSIVPSTLHYGLLDADGALDVRLTFDHRVYDGGPAARALTEVEAVLNDEIVAELRGVRPVAAA
jgi:hypothetical protein